MPQVKIPAATCSRCPSKKTGGAFSRKVSQIYLSDVMNANLFITKN